MIRTQKMVFRVMAVFRKSKSDYVTDRESTFRLLEIANPLLNSASVQG